MTFTSLEDRVLADMERETEAQRRSEETRRSISMLSHAERAEFERRLKAAETARWWERFQFFAVTGTVVLLIILAGVANL